MFNMKKYQKQYRKEHKEERNNRATLWRKKHPGYNKKYLKKFRKKHPDYNNEWIKKNRWKYKKQNRARSIIGHYISRGQLTHDICAICGSELNIEAHHENYDEPLVIIWLCKTCHSKIHNKELLE